METPRKLIRELAETAWLMSVADCTRKRPGQMINSLPNHKREILKELKIEDIQDVRWPPF